MNRNRRSFIAFARGLVFAGDGRRVGAGVSAAPAQHRPRRPALRHCCRRPTPLCSMSSVRKTVTHTSPPIGTSSTSTTPAPQTSV